MEENNDKNKALETQESQEQDSSSVMSEEEYELLKSQILEAYAEIDKEDEEDDDDDDDKFHDSKEEREHASVDSEQNIVKTDTKIKEDNPINANNTTNNHNEHKFDTDEDNFEVESASYEDTDMQPKQVAGERQDAVPEIDQGVSKVAISKKSSIAIMLGFGLVMIYVVYSMLQPSDEEVAMEKKSEISTSQPIITPIADVGQNVIVPEIPKLPDVPTLSAPIPPPAATPTPPPVMDIVVPNVATPALPTVPAAPNQVMTPVVPSMVVAPPSSNAGIIGVGRSGPTAEEQAEAARKRAKITSSIMLKSGSGTTASQSVNSEGKALNVLVRNTDQVVATHVGEQQRLIMQGKIIDAVLETAINTDLPGSLRAVVSRDVYSETGKNILINRGSRLVGTYSSTVAYGVARVQILWERIIRPDGVDIKISSGGVDNLGRSGTPGEVDNHIMQNLSSAMMISTLDIALATYFDKNSSSSSSTTTTVTPGVSTSGEASTTGAVVTPTVTSGETPTNAEDSSKEALSKIQEIGKQILAKSMARPPTVTVNQGASLKVYVKKDLLFPGSSANLTRVIE